MITGFVNGQDLRITQPVIASGTLAATEVV